MTNNHVHIFAMLPYRKLLRIIQKIDPVLYNKIYVLNDASRIHQVELINDDVSGISYEENTKREHWLKLDEMPTSFKKNLVIRNSTDMGLKAFDKFEQIQYMFRTFIRNYKVYYYLWYTTLYVNYHNNVFYINVRGKPGSINLDVKFGERFYIDSKHVYSEDKFMVEMSKIIKDDRDINSSNFKYMYGFYLRIKYESDLIMKAISDFNQDQAYPFYVDDKHLMDDEIKVDFEENYVRGDTTSKPPQLMVQYIINFPKKSKKIPLDLKKFVATIKINLYIAVLINNQYGYQFFNGIDLVGNEEDSHDLSEFIPILNKILYFRRFGINFIPHIGETSMVREEFNLAEKYVFDKNINRVGHGISFVSTQKLISLIEKTGKVIYIESCPISNYILGFYHPKHHPHRNVTTHPKIRLMICSDDNGLFNYSSVTRDYIFIYKYWHVTLSDIKLLILNGLAVIPYKYRKYYMDVFEILWADRKLDEVEDKLVFT